MTLFPVLVIIYVRLARREEQQAREVFGDAYRAYVRATPGWWPRWSSFLGSNRK